MYNIRLPSLVSSSYFFSILFYFFVLFLALTLLLYIFSHVKAHTVFILRLENSLYHPINRTSNLTFIIFIEIVLSIDMNCKPLAVRIHITCYSNMENIRVATHKLIVYKMHNPLAVHGTLFYFHSFSFSSSSCFKKKKFIAHIQLFCLSFVSSSCVVVLQRIK